MKEKLCNICGKECESHSTDQYMLCSKKAMNGKSCLNCGWSVSTYPMKCNNSKVKKISECDLDFNWKPKENEMEKKQFEKDEAMQFLDNIITTENDEHNDSVKRAFDNMHRQNYIKKSDLEIAEEEYDNKFFDKTDRCYYVDIKIINLIHEQKKEITRLKEKLNEQK